MLILACAGLSLAAGLFENVSATRNAAQCLPAASSAAENHLAGWEFPQVPLNSGASSRAFRSRRSGVLLGVSLPSPDRLLAERRDMIEDIKRLALAAGAETGRPTLDERVLDAMAHVPRHEFVPASQARAAYKNRPLPIGHGQTISQPYIVALMTDLLRLKPRDVVLEVGTGSGYQAAVLSRLAAKVYTIEIVEPLGREAANTLARVGHANVETRIGDGYQGWPEHAPYDAIIVTAAPDHIPPALLAQLRPGGRMVIPVGDFNQELMVVEKNPDGTTVTERIVPVRFVPLTRDREK